MCRALLALVGLGALGGAPARAAPADATSPAAPSAPAGGPSLSTPAAPGVARYALVVGSNLGGPGQTALRYAETDAARVAGVLRELGDYAVALVPRPSPALVLRHLELLAAQIAADVAAGRQAQLVFYYSGHARASAIDLAADELPLAVLRQRLIAIPATLTVVVLDACQSGAFSRVKGASPAADFSFSSRQHLDARGLAVLASSTASELSQESEQLGSSYFTHHLLVALRGAGDTNRDGAVSIDEAYRYAYHQTLLSTAATAVGGQHVSLEVELQGHGEVALAFPRRASAAIELPAALAGQALIEDRAARTVVAETYKAPGQATRVAVAPGAYDVLVRQAGQVRRCPVEVGSGTATVELERCAREEISAARAKGDPPRAVRVELAGLVGFEREDAYTRTLRSFGYAPERGAFDDAVTGLGAVALWQIDRRVWLGGVAHYVRARTWSMSTERRSLEFTWATATLGPLVRVRLPIIDARGAHLAAYGQLGAGLGLSPTRFVDQDGAVRDERFLGWATTMAAGLALDGERGFGAALGYQFDYAPVIENLAGETHGSGGHRIAVGLGYTFGGAR